MQAIVPRTCPVQGRVAISIDPYNPRTACTAERVNNSRDWTSTCDGMWAVVQTTASLGVRISATAPCSPPFANMSLCNASSACRPGPYFIGVTVMWSPTAYILNAVIPGAPITLLDSQPQAAATSSKYPAIFAFTAAYTAQLPPVRI